jgi:hypothetical protein
LEKYRQEKEKMDINTTLLREIKAYLSSYDCYQDEVEKFLMTKMIFTDRQRKAIDFINNVMTCHGKKELLSYVAELARIEHGIRELEPWVRDHVVHAVLSFLLGIYLNEKFLISSTCANVTGFQWEIAGLFHDVGYPAQVAKDILKQFADKINGIKKSIGVPSKDINFKVVPNGFENLQNDIDGFNLIQQQLNNWELQIDARKEYNHMIESGDICHGMISSFAVLNIVDLLYQKYNPNREYKDHHAIPDDNICWNQIHFEQDVVPACSAIFIHNLPSRCFTKTKINHSKAPLAFLLKLSDCLQEWERPSANDTNGLSATNFDIEIIEDKLIFRANIPYDKKNKIREEILLSLTNPNVEIR